MAGKAALEAVRARLIEQVRQADYRGYDPYDGLLSPLTRLPPLRYSALFRLIWQQLVKRLPASARPLLGIPPQENPKALALFLEGWLDWEKAPDREEQIGELLSRLQRHFREGPLCGWGYPFPWQSRLFFLPAGVPNSVVTAFAVAALSRCEGGMALALQAAESLWNIRQEGPYGPFIPYIPQNATFVPNVSALAAWAFVRISKKTGEHTWEARARALAEAVAAFQRPDGSWSYADHPRMGWVDNFHTGYILVSLQTVVRATGDKGLQEVAEGGYRFWRTHFFDGKGLPVGGTLRKPAPADIHDYTQAIETLLAFSEKEAALRVAEGMVERLWDPGRRCFQKSPDHRSCYIRWGQAWAFKSLSHLLKEIRS